MVAVKFNSSAQELRKTGIKYLKVRRRPSYQQAPIGNGGDSSRAIGALQRIEPALHGDVRKFEGHARLAVDRDHVIARVVTFDQIGAVSPGSFYVDAVWREHRTREGKLSGRNGDSVACMGDVNRCLQI